MRDSISWYRVSIGLVYLYILEKVEISRSQSLKVSKSQGLNVSRSQGDGGLGVTGVTGIKVNVICEAVEVILSVK